MIMGTIKKLSRQFGNLRANDAEVVLSHDQHISILTADWTVAGATNGVATVTFATLGLPQMADDDYFVFAQGSQPTHTAANHVLCLDVPRSTCTTSGFTVIGEDVEGNDMANSDVLRFVIIGRVANQEA